MQIITLSFEITGENSEVWFVSDAELSGENILPVVNNSAFLSAPLREKSWTLSRGLKSGLVSTVPGLNANKECDVADVVWKIAHGVLPTKAYFHTWKRLGASERCSRCQARESISHLPWVRSGVVCVEMDVAIYS